MDTPLLLQATQAMDESLAATSFDLAGYQTHREVDITNFCPDRRDQRCSIIISSSQFQGQLSRMFKIAWIRGSNPMCTGHYELTPNMLSRTMASLVTHNPLFGEAFAAGCTPLHFVRIVMEQLYGITFTEEMRPLSIPPAVAAFNIFPS